MATLFERLFSRKRTPQHEPIPGSRQVPNTGGGFGWAVDDWTRLGRFLILGSEGGSYYVTEKELTRQNAQAVERCVKADGVRAVELIATVSESGRAPKNDPALFALAMAAKLGDETTRRAALAALPRVCRTGTHLCHFAAYVELFGGWGRGVRRAVAGWYNGRPPAELAYQLVKYQARDGWSNRDILRLCHARPASPEHDQLFRWAVKGTLSDSEVGPGLRLVGAMEAAKGATTAQEISQLIGDHRLPREAVPTRWLKDPVVWEALLASMPLGALIRNLATMTRVGLLVPLGQAVTTVVERLRSDRDLQKARIHPVAVLAALLTYRSGRSAVGRAPKGAKGSTHFTPVTAIVEALDEAFYRTFAHVEPANRRVLLALDVSGSMGTSTVAGVPGLTPRVASCAMALVTAATEPAHELVAFTAASGGHGGKWGGGTPGLTRLTIGPRQRLDDAVASTEKLAMGGTDCSLPMQWALENRVEVDTFVVYTDSETWAGAIHPSQALREYRQRMGRAARLVVVGMVSNGFSIADPDDAGMLDVVGFDTATPAVISDFARG